MVILGVLVAPSVATCFNSPDGMGQCLRGKLVDVGLIPAPPAAAVAETETPAEPATAPAAETPVETAKVDEGVGAEPALDVTPPVDATAAGNVITATFSLLRAEPDGSVVIAGSGTPGSKVEIFANGDLLGTSDVEQSGDWAFVPDKPLAPGGLEITLGEEGKTGTAAQSFVVVINDDKTTQPLVVASTPGKASDVLQGLSETRQVATAEPATPAATPAPATAPAPEAPTAATSTPAVAPAETAATPAATTPAANAPATDAPATDAAATPAAAPATETAPAAPQTATANAPAAAPAPAAQPEAATAAVAPTIDAIEVDGDRTFFAGAGPDGGTIRLYVDDAFVADTKVDAGRWLVEAGPVLGKPSQRVRVDLLKPGSADVAARSEVDFVVDVPADQKPVVVADAPAAPATPSPAPAKPAEPAPASTAAPAAPAAAPAAPTAQPEASSTQPAAPANPAPAAAPATPAPASAPAAAAPASTAVAPTPAPAEAPAAPAAEPAPAVAAAEPAPVAEGAEAPKVPTLVAVSLGDPDAQRFASGKAIIRRGDNLWTIARRVYGEGLKYTTIYEANTGSIRDPDRIYPGQVFDLPKSGAAQ